MLYPQRTFSPHSRYSGMSFSRSNSRFIASPRAARGAGQGEMGPGEVV